jgi:hypothetical protein
LRVNCFPNITAMSAVRFKLAILKVSAFLQNGPSD